MTDATSRKAAGWPARLSDTRNVRVQPRLNASWRYFDVLPVKGPQP